MTTYMDLSLPLSGTLPVDHGYAIFSALSHRISSVHDNRDLSILHVRGKYDEATRSLVTDDNSALTIRIPSTQFLPEFAMLGGETFTFPDHKVRLGRDVRVGMHRPVASLTSHGVVIANTPVKETVEVQRAHFEQALRTQLSALAKNEGFDTTQIKVVIGKRRILRIGAVRTIERKAGPVEDQSIVVGFQVILSNLSSKASLALQGKGLGGRHHMGCGSFVPSPRSVVVG